MLRACELERIGRAERAGGHPAATADAADIDAARKLLQELFSELPATRHPQPEQ
jgi:hypothetical protein